MDGPISDVDGELVEGRAVFSGDGLPKHTVQLVELHTISEPFPVGRCTSQADVEAIVMRCAQRAREYADDLGVELGDVTRVNTATSAGMCFSLMIGAGHPYDEPAWVWTSRWQHWYDRLRQVARPRPPVAPGHTDGTGDNTGDNTNDNERCPVIPLFSGERPVVGSEYGID